MKKVMLALALVAGSLGLVACGQPTEAQKEFKQLREACAKNPSQEACNALKTGEQ